MKKLLKILFILTAFIINAQTGKMEDYMSKEKNRARYKKVLTWGEIHR